MLIPSTGRYVGGKFVITDSTGSRNVTGITITEGGTVDGQANLDNIELWYEIDSTAPYDGASVSFDGDETQFGSTDTDGFSAADGTSAFAGSVGISTTATMVVYVVFDVGAGATDGETVEISIEDPSTEVTVDSGVVSPDSAVAISGTTTLSDPACSGTVSVQSGTATIAANNPSTTATLSPALADMGKAFLVFSSTVDDNRPEYTWISGQITNTTTVTYERDNGGLAGAAVSIEWYVVEFTTGVTVQRGVQFMSSPTRNVTLPSSVDTTRSFPIISYRNASGNTDNDDFMRAKIIDGGATLELSTVSTPSNGFVEWQVVQYDDSFVQTGDLSFSSGQSSRTATLAQSVNTSKSWLIYNFKSDSGTVTNIGQKLVRGEITNGTTLTFDRDNTGQNVNLTWFLVEFADATLVQHDNQSFTNAETQKDVTINGVTTAKSIADGGYFGRGGKSPYSSDDNPGVGWFTLDLTSSTNLQITRAITGSSTADIYWSVVEFCSATDVIVSASGTQTVSMVISSTDQYVGAKFVIADNTGSRNVTSITITESGTVDGQLDLDNIKLFYELDTTGPYDGASESYGGGRRSSVRRTPMDSAPRTGRPPSRARSESAPRRRWWCMWCSTWARGRRLARPSRSASRILRPR